MFFPLEFLVIFSRVFDGCSRILKVFFLGSLAVVLEAVFFSPGIFVVFAVPLGQQQKASPC